MSRFTLTIFCMCKKNFVWKEVKELVRLITCYVIIDISIETCYIIIK